MHRFAFRFVVLSLTFCFLFSYEVRADFKLLDAIQEFGEKRFVKTTPKRLKAGPLNIHPTLRKSVEYDDNILLEPQDKRSDIIYNIKPGAILELPVKTHQFAIGYEAEFEFFTKQRHHRQNDQNQNFFALADIRFPDWYINVFDYLSETSSRSGTTFTDRIPRIDHAINPKVGYKWKRVTFEQGFRHYTRDFRQQVNDRFDFQVVEWSSVIFYDLFARLKALMEYKWGQIDYDDDQTRGANINQVRLGLEGEPFTNVFVKLRAGPQFRNYHVSSEQDFRALIASAEVDYQVRKDLKLKFKATREPVEATFGDVNFYREHLLSAGFEYRFRPRWTFYEDTSFFRHDYSERETINGHTGFRRDIHVGVKTGIRYAFREWWEWELSYEYWHRHSNFEALNYNDNRVILSSNLAY